MSTAAEREPLLSNQPSDDSTDQNGQQKPGIVPQREVVLAIPNHLTGETFDNVPVHKRKLGLLRILSRRYQSSHASVHDSGLTSVIFIIFNSMLGTGLVSIPLNPRFLIYRRTGSSPLRVLS